MKQDRAYVVYLPADYAAAAGPYPSVYFQDGGDYLTMGQAPTILDNLIALGAIPPLVAVFVSPVDRDREYHCNPAYVRFFCDELVPALHAQYTLRDDPAARAVVGPSLGGLISLYLGRQRPDRFGLIGAQSSAVHSWGPSQFDARRSFAARRRLPLRLHLSIGRYEDCFASDAAGRCRDLRTGVRELRAVLDRAGYPLQYTEYPQGHSWGLWRDSLPEALQYFFGRDSGGSLPSRATL